jgi:hypothetical protein
MNRKIAGAMPVKRWSRVAVGVIAVVGAVCLITGCNPIIRNAGYHEMIRAYEAAAPVPTGREGQAFKWDFEVRLSAGRSVRVQAPGYPGVARVVYSDESQPRDLYEYKDYSVPAAIRVTGSRLFVYWCETLLHSACWLLDYDLAARKEVGRRRVDPKDLLPTGSPSSR